MPGTKKGVWTAEDKGKIVLKNLVSSLQRSPSLKLVQQFNIYNLQFKIFVTKQFLF